jgi:hypothetical protein
MNNDLLPCKHCDIDQGQTGDSLVSAVNQDDTVHCGIHRDEYDRYSIILYNDTETIHAQGVGITVCPFCKRNLT